MLLLYLIHKFLLELCRRLVVDALCCQICLVDGDVAGAQLFFDVVTAVTLDGDGPDSILFTPEFYFAGNPRLSPRGAWQYILGHYRITVGSLWIRPRDLMRLALLMCHKGTEEGVTLLQPETVEEMMSEQKGKGAVTADTPYGLCVHHETSLVKGKTFYGHQGMFQDVLCDVYYDPETDFVFLLVTNGGNNSMNDHVTSLCRKTFALAWETYGAH